MRHVICTLQERNCVETTASMQDEAISHVGRLLEDLPRATFTAQRIISRGFTDEFPQDSMTKIHVTSGLGDI